VLAAAVSRFFPSPVEDDMSTKPAPLLECRRCGAGFDVSDMKPDTRFPCENCRAYLRVPRPKRRGGLVGAAITLGILVVAVGIYFLTTGGGPGDPARTLGPAADARPAAETPSEKPAEVDLVQLDYEEFARKARTGRVPDLLALGKFCREHERYAEEARRAFRLVLKQEPENEEALEALGLARLEGLYLPRAKHEAMIRSPWYANARAVLDKEVKDQQGLRDLGLSYAFAPPFLIVRERNDDDAVDRAQRRRAVAVLEGMAEAFDRLIGEDLGVRAAKTDRVIPVFWHRTERGERIWEDSRRPDLKEEESGKWIRNEHWTVVKEEDVTRLVRSPFAEWPAYELVAALLCSEKIRLPGWLVDGLSCQVACLRLEEVRHAEPVATYDVDNPGDLRATARDPKRSRANAMVGIDPERSEFAKRLLEELKKRGITNVTIDTVTDNLREVPSRDAWAFVRFLLKSDPDRRARFVDYVKRVRKGERWGAAFHAAFAEGEEKKCDIEALDRAWLDWMKAKTERTADD
jgi:hypothetical protein